MGTISDKLMRIINTKEDIRQALISKGYDVPTSIPFKEYAKMISDLPCRANPFPDIEGIVARYSALGLTNEQMAANPVWADKTGNDHDLQMKNFAWGEMSGVGGYTENYNSNRWYKVESRIDATWTYKSFNARSIKDNRSAQLFYQSSLSDTGFRVLSCTIKVSGLTDGQGIEYVCNGTQQFVLMRIENDGIYHLPSFDFGAKNAYYGFKFLKLQESCNITIEQLPLYPGALVFDGVDDYGVCDNFPILTKEKGYTVVALRKWLTPENKTNNEVLVANLKEPRWIIENWGAFGCEVKYNNVNPKVKRTMSFGNTPVINVNENNVLLCQTSNNYNGVDIVSGNNTSGPYLLICSGGTSFFAKAAIWELIILDHDATEEELTKIKNYFIETYPWLFFDQAWTVVGKSNEDTDRATIANIAGNGNDLVLSNFGFSKNSGYGLYQQNYAIWIKVSNRATFTVTSSKIHVTSVTAEEHADFIYTTGQRLKQKIRITGLPEGVSFVIGRSGVNLKIISQDGIYDVDILDDSSANPIIGYRINRILDSCDITIEQIPEYEGYLITDGVDDKVQSYSFTMNEDWTIVGDWELLSNVQINCGIVKAQNVYLYNTANGLLISINNPRSLQSLGTKSLHAICSDGRLYDRNWVEYEYTVATVESSLNIGFNLNNYTQIAFKNLGIYNNQILSKDDCIKAYNYLQTLKAK
jgi:hypothetical protein